MVFLRIDIDPWSARTLQNIFVLEGVETLIPWLLIPSWHVLGELVLSFRWSRTFLLLLFLVIPSVTLARLPTKVVRNLVPPPTPLPFVAQ